MAKTLYVRNVPDETNAVLNKLAADEGTNVSEYVRRILDELATRERRRLEMEAFDADLDEIHAQMTKHPTMQDAVDAVRGIRDEYDKGTA